MLVAGKVSWFGGPFDKGVAPDEDLAFIYSVDDAPHLFLPRQPPDTTGLARRLNPLTLFLAMRWDYDETPREQLLAQPALIIAPLTGRSVLAWPADWGPHSDTNRVADVSMAVMFALGIVTDDEVEVEYPYTKK
jgi:hypothetical protein